MRIPPIGISHAVAETLFDDASAALEDVGKFNDALFAELDVDRFFYQRPALLQAVSRRSRQEYRGANAGDFSGINEIDLLLGLCRGTTRTTRSSSSRRCSSCTPLTRRACATACGDEVSWTSSSMRSTRAPARSGSAATPRRSCASARARTGRRAAPRPARRALHRGAVEGARREPPRAGDGERPAAPGAPSALEVLRDLRLAAPREDIASRYTDIERLEAAVGTVA